MSGLTQHDQHETESPASRWATLLMQPIINTLSVRGIKPLVIGEEYFKFIDENGNEITVKFVCKNPLI